MYENKNRPSLFESVFEFSPDGITIKSADMTKIIYANPAFSEMTGYSLTELEQISPKDLHPRDRFEFINSQFEATIKGENAVVSEIPCLCKNKEIIFADLNIANAYIENQLHIIGFWRDVTERRNQRKEKKSLQDQLMQAQKMEAIGQLAAGISHDFNNLLCGIIGFAHLIKSGAENFKPENLIRNSEMIIDLGKRGGELTQQLLGFSRKDRFNPSEIILNDTAEEVISVLKRTISRKIRISTDYKPDLPPVSADATQMHQILLNVCLNSRDALPDGGEIKIRTDEVRLDQEFCSKYPFASPGHYLLLSVTDNGTGMDKDTLNKIFEPFFTTKEFGKGYGMGMAMVYGIIKNHKGNIIINSAPGEGTKVHIYVPKIPLRAKNHHLLPPKNKINDKNNSGRILVVDDEPVIREVAGYILEHAGYKAFYAANGREAVDIFNREAPDLVVLDSVMPVMDGKDACIEIMKTNPNAKIIIASGYNTDRYVKSILDLGAKDYIKKPYSAESFLECVKKNIL
ncbi:MAG: response regulator [Fibrobacterota bacterium]